MPEEQGFKKDWLKGLKFRYATSKKVKGDDGRMRMEHTPKERAMTEKDVLSFRETTDGKVIMVTADGQKLTVAK